MRIEQIKTALLKAGATEKQADDFCSNLEQRGDYKFKRKVWRVVEANSNCRPAPMTVEDYLFQRVFATLKQKGL